MDPTEYSHFFFSNHMTYLLMKFVSFYYHFSIGKFRHLPVVENGEVTAMLNINKCLYDAISRLEKTVEQGKAIAADIEGFDSQSQGNFSGC